ncbi:hypothetical protein [Brevundimonas vesicularis]|uniref:hypothetical protein n=1 Tax=Brevundimonas vesicularis TaxID=41276 RepID=UPI0020C69E7B|nr:hypothetical protein [Brevundimonas vesicularis]
MRVEIEEGDARAFGLGQKPRQMTGKHGLSDAALLIVDYEGSHPCFLLSSRSSSETANPKDLSARIMMARTVVSSSEARLRTASQRAGSA